MILFVKIFAVQYLSIFDDHYLTTILSIAFAVNLMGRFVWNKVYESMVSIRNKKFVLFMMNCILCIFVASLSVTRFHADLLYAVWIMVLFAVMGCDWILYPSLIAITFGQNYSGHIMGYCCLADIPALLILVVVGNHLSVSDNGQSWEGFTLIIAAFLVFSALLVLVFDPLKVIAEREGKNSITTSSKQFPSYQSHDSVHSGSSGCAAGSKGKTSCGCEVGCNCECCQ